MTTTIAKFAVEWKKIQEISKLNHSVELHNSINSALVSYCTMIKTDIQSLMHLYFRSAFENLGYAISASSDNQKGYLLQAKNRFIDAITMEKNQNLITSYIGLSLCQTCLGDDLNATKTLRRVIDVEVFLPDDVDDLIKEWEYGQEVIELFMRIMLMCCRINLDNIRAVRHGDINLEDYFEKNKDKIKAFVSGYGYYGKYLDDIAYAFTRFLFKMCYYDFNLGEPNSLVQAAKSAIRQIMHEDFTSFKQGVIEAFHL